MRQTARPAGNTCTISHSLVAASPTALAPGLLAVVKMAGVLPWVVQSSQGRTVAHLCRQGAVRAHGCSWALAPRCSGSYFHRILVREYRTEPLSLVWQAEGTHTHVRAMLWQVRTAPTRSSQTYKARALKHLSEDTSRALPASSRSDGNNRNIW